MADLVNVGASLVGQVALHQLEHLIERHERADWLAGEGRPVRHQHLVGLFNDCPVAAAVVSRRTRLEPNARHDADAKVDVVRRIRIELQKIELVDVRATSRSFEPKGGVQQARIG